MGGWACYRVPFSIVVEAVAVTDITSALQPTITGIPVNRVWAVCGCGWKIRLAASNGTPSFVHSIFGFPFMLYLESTAIFNRVSLFPHGHGAKVPNVRASRSIQEAPHFLEPLSYPGPVDFLSPS